MDARRAFDNNKRDQFTQYTFGVNYGSYMDQLIGSIIESQDSHHWDTTDRKYELSQHANTDTEPIVVVSTVDTRCLGIVNSPPCRDINYPHKVRGYMANSGLCIESWKKYLLESGGSTILAIRLSSVYFPA